MLSRIAIWELLTFNDETAFHVVLKISLVNIVNDHHFWVHSPENAFIMQSQKSP